VIALDQVLDIAVLQSDIDQQPFLSLGDSRLAEVGERIAVIGSPLGFDGTLSEGIISAKRDAGGERKWLQITAPLSPGSSGSPVLNARGEVIGVATMIASGGQALNFAIPIAWSKSSVPQTTSEKGAEQRPKRNLEKSDALPPQVVKELEAQDYTGRPLPAAELATREDALGRAVREELQKGDGSSPVYKAYLMEFWHRHSKTHQ
jgi:S1-C subfamily serine protease